MSEFGRMQIDFTATEPGSVRVSVKARVDNRADLDKLVEALNAARELLPESGGHLKGEGD